MQLQVVALNSAGASFQSVPGEEVWRADKAIYRVHGKTGRAKAHSTEDIPGC